MKSKCIVLGPEFSFTHIAATKIDEDLEIIFAESIAEVFEKVNEGKIEYGLVPIENMLNGNVRESLFNLMKYPVQIVKSIDQGIHHCIAATDNKFTKIISHPQALAQCSNFIKENYKGVSVGQELSTSFAMKKASLDPFLAAIGSKYAAKHFGLEIIEENIENNHSNKTRFIMISKSKTKYKAKKNIKSSLMIIPNRDRPGLLFDILSVFNLKKINLTKIESIPSGKALGSYNFYIDIDGSIENEDVKEAFEFLESFVEIKVFGSYELIKNVK